MSFTRRSARAKKTVKSIRLGGVRADRTIGVKLKRVGFTDKKQKPERAMMEIVGLKPVGNGPVVICGARLLPFKWHEYKEFDRLSNLACSQNQMDRIRGRLGLDKLTRTLGRDKCHQIFSYIMRRDDLLRMGLPK